MSALERALRELESATAVTTSPAEDLGVAREAFERRQRAIADLARLTGAPHTLSPEVREDALRRLHVVNEAGAATEKWLETVKSDAMAEWNQWSRIYRALGAASAAKPTIVDYNG